MLFPKTQGEDFPYLFMASVGGWPSSVFLGYSCLILLSSLPLLAHGLLLLGLCVRISLSFQG